MSVTKVEPEDKGILMEKESMKLYFTLRIKDSEMEWPAVAIRFLSQAMGKFHTYKDIEPYRQAVDAEVKSARKEGKYIHVKVYLEVCGDSNRRIGPMDVDLIVKTDKYLADEFFGHHDSLPVTSSELKLLADSDEYAKFFDEGDQECKMTLYLRVTD